MVITSPAQAALTPAGKPLAPGTPLLEIPVAMVVVWVMGVNAVLIQRVGVVEGAPAVLSAGILQAKTLTENPQLLSALTLTFPS